MKLTVLRKTATVTEYELKEEDTKNCIELYYNNCMICTLPAEDVTLKCVESNSLKKLLYVCIYKNNKYVCLIGYVTKIVIEEM